MPASPGVRTPVPATQLIANQITTKIMIERFFSESISDKAGVFTTSGVTPPGRIAKRIAAPIQAEIAAEAPMTGPLLAR